jgi:hypothetical protein
VSPSTHVGCTAVNDSNVIAVIIIIIVIAAMRLCITAAAAAPATPAVVSARFFADLFRAVKRLLVAIGRRAQLSRYHVARIRPEYPGPLAAAAAIVIV